MTEYWYTMIDIVGILIALGNQYQRAPFDSDAQAAANLYYRLKGRFVTETYKRKLTP